MKDWFLRNAFGEPCALSVPRELSWSPEAQELLRAHLAGVPVERLRGTARTLRYYAERAARIQQYHAVTETTLRAQIARLGHKKTEGEKDR